MASKSHRKFTAKFKLQVFAAAEKTSNKQSARDFGIGESNVRKRKKKTEELKKLPSYNVHYVEKQLGGLYIQ